MPNHTEPADLNRVAVNLGQSILTQLRIANRLTAVSLKATVQQQELVRILASTGASNQEIADVLDTTPATVATALQRLKKKAQKNTAQTVPVASVSTEIADSPVDGQ